MRNMTNPAGKDIKYIKHMTRKILPWVSWWTEKEILLERYLMCWQLTDLRLSYIFVIVSKERLELRILCNFKIMGTQTVSHIILPAVWVSEVEDVSGWL